MTDTKAVRTIPEWEKEFVEAGAHLEHERWAKWQAYVHSKCVEHENGKGEWVCFPTDRFRRWERQIATPYSELSENEKNSDRAEVEQYLPLVRELLTTREAEAYKQGQMNPQVGFLRQYLNEETTSTGTWTDEQILRFLRIPFITNPKETEK
jgi:hypothetical protein